jgi:MFS family permease
MSDSTVASLVAMNLLPHTWKFVWAPIADVTLTRKKWYVLANVVSCATLLSMAFIPFSTGNLTTFKLLIFINSLAISFLGMAVEGLMAAATPETQRGRAAGWFQAGNLGGYGIGGGLALYVAETVSITTSFVTTAAILGMCTFGLQLVPEVKPEHSEDQFVGSTWQRIIAAIREVFKDLYRTLASRGGVIALVVCFMPLGAGAAQGLFSAIAGRWQTSGEVVAITAGILGGSVAMVGCLVGGWFSDRVGRRLAYILAGVILAGVAALMALAPQNVYAFVAFTLAYQFVSGMVYACFTGFVLEVIGGGAIATKYNALASLSNIPILYMTYILGAVSDDHGPVMMLFVDAGAAMLGLFVLVIAIGIVRPGAKPKAVS